jgi:hypothetical protein
MQERSTGRIGEGANKRRQSLRGPFSLYAERALGRHGLHTTSPVRPFAHSPFRLLPSLLRDLPDDFRQQVVFGCLDSGV